MSKQELLNVLLAPALEIAGIKTDSEISVNEQRIAELLFPWRSKEASVNK